MTRIAILTSTLSIVASGCGGTSTSDVGTVTSLRALTSERRRVNAIELGGVESDREITFVLGVRLPSRGALDGFLHERRAGAAPLAPDEFAERFAVSAIEYQRLVDWLRGEGLTVVRTTRGRTSITVRGSAATVARALSADVRDFEDHDGRFLALAGDLHMPLELGALLSGTIGLDGERGWVSHRVTRGPQPTGAPDHPVHPNDTPPPDPGPCALDPKVTATNGLAPGDLQSLYGATGLMAPGAGATVAILGAGTPPDPIADVLAFANHFKLGSKIDSSGTASASNQYVVDLVGGANRDPYGELGEYGENILDIDMVLALAPAATVHHVMAATNTPGLFTDAMSFIVNDLANVSAVSLSYGSCERGSAGEMPVVNALLAQAEAQGQLWFVAAGDSASDGCGDSSMAGGSNRVVSAGWPASSPFAVGVGGTSFNTALDQETSGAPPLPTAVTLTTVELPWVLGGGGPSESFAKPDFQKGVTPDDSARDTPDVAAFADGTPGVCVVMSRFDGAPTSYGGVGGTSCAAPMWAGVWAILSQAYAAKHAGAPLPNGLPIIYRLGAATHGATLDLQPLKDVTAGQILGPDLMDSDAYPAGPAYDLATGWGTPNLAQLIPLVEALP